MHEASLAGGVLRVVEDAQARERFARVSLLRLSAGALAGVETRALRFALEAIQPGSLLEGARIEIDETPGRGAPRQWGRAGGLAPRPAHTPPGGPGPRRP
ncbi:MAG: hydrogenase maturation nickel metallochaperone HypA, partial [Pseudomonadota bacterium]